MNDLLSDPRFSLAVATGLVAMSVWIFKSHSRRLELLEREAVKKEDLTMLREDLKAEHKENSTKLDGIEAAVTGTHRRIDELYRDLVKAARGP